MAVDLSRIPRRRLAHLPTPLEALDRLRSEIGGPPLWIKRDDCTGLATGGNKARKLEFLVGAALEASADTLVTFGALQSNHARQTAAAAARVGLACELILVRRVAWDEPAYTRAGNLLLDELLGARIHVVDDDAEAARRLAERLAFFEAKGRSAYVIPPGGSNATGALGYVVCAGELLEQARAAGFSPGTIVHATSSTGTQAGLLVGLRAHGSAARVLGVNVYSRDRAKLERTLAAACAELAEDLAVPPPPAAALQVDHDFLGPDYGIPTDAMRDALRRVARCEGILLDPVYSGKAMAALIARVQRGDLPRDEPVVFLHTGGAASLSAYPQALTSA